MENQKATIKDIAKRLGISASTVSRALNDKFVKNDTMVSLIKKTAQEMDYQTNTIAQGLRTKKSNLIGIVVPSITHSFFAAVLAGVQSVLNDRGYNILICQSNEKSDLEQQQINSLVRCNVDGLLISCAQETKDEQFLNKIGSKGIKIVYYDRQNFATEKPVVKVDDVDGGYLATKHLLDKGAQRLIYVGGPAELPVAQDRFDGFINAMAERQVEPVGHRFCNTLDEVAAFVRSNVKNKVDGVVCFSDDFAAQSIIILQKNKIRVPKDAMVIGYDNSTLCDLVEPSMTSVIHEAGQIGKLAGQTLMNLIENKPVKQHQLLETKVIQRNSTAR